MVWLHAAPLFAMHHPAHGPAPQEFFSFEAFADFWRQLLSTRTVPAGLETPDFTTLRRQVAAD